MIDRLNTWLAEVSSKLAERISRLERDKDILGSRVNAFTNICINSMMGRLIGLRLWNRR